MVDSNSSSPNPFRAGVNFLLQGLFFETVGADKSKVLYTLKDRDHEGYPSLYLKYMECNDPTEWTFANAYLENWSHWERLCECTWFKPYVERWRKELSLRLKSKALARIISESKSSSKEAFGASKYLLEKGWEEKEAKAGRGRPSKDEVRKAAKEIATNNDRLLKDLERINPQNKIGIQ